MPSIPSLTTPIRHKASRLLHVYADKRVGATDLEKRCYKKTDSILLTFDDYGSVGDVERLLTILATKRVRSMFFLVGSWAVKHPELVQKIRDAGHVIGNHTATHATLTTLPDAKVEQELQDSINTSVWLRPPRGRYNARIRRIASRLGYAICYWTIDSRDWAGASIASMEHTIFAELRPGATILFHIHGTHTLDALPAIIDGIRVRGYHLTDWGEPDWSPPVSA